MASSMISSVCTRLLMNASELHVYTIDADSQVHVADFVRLCDVTPVSPDNILISVNNPNGSSWQSKTICRNSPFWLISYDWRLDS